MSGQAPTILALASYFKGQEFLREAKRLGARVLLLTREKLAGPRGRWRVWTSASSCPISIDVTTSFTPSAI
jgi:hypothetical protein